MRSKEELLALHREYNRVHKEEINLKNSIYRAKHKDRIRTDTKKRHREHRAEEANLRNVRRAKNLKSWSGLIPYKTTCQLCGKDIYYKPLDKRNAIYFDHRHEGSEPIRTSPSQWLKNHERNKTNEEVWIKSDFGMLCHLCNARIPAMDRKGWMNRLIKYISNSVSN